MKYFFKSKHFVTPILIYISKHHYHQGGGEGGSSSEYRNKSPKRVKVKKHSVSSILIDGLHIECCKLNITTPTSTYDTGALSHGEKGKGLTNFSLNKSIEIESGSLVQLTEESLAIHLDALAHADREEQITSPPVGQC